MLVLAIDTSTPAVTAGIAKLAGDQIETITTRVIVDARAHGELLTPQIRDIAAEAEISLDALDAIVCGAGPGPFTGLRAGMATAGALGHALGIPVYPVCGLDAIAADALSEIKTRLAKPDDVFLVATDARRREIYWAVYNLDGQRIEGPDVCRPAELTSITQMAAGDGARLYEEVLGLTIVDHPFPTPAGLISAALAELISETEPKPLTPLYLRRPDAKVPAARKKVTIS